LSLQVFNCRSFFQIHLVLTVVNTTMATSEPPQTLKVLFHLHKDLDTLDFAGPLEILSHATYPSTATSDRVKVFQSTITATSEFTTTGQGATIKRHIPIEEAYATLADYDVLLIPGGGSPGVLEGKAEPIGLIKAFGELEKRKDRRIRTLLSVCTGSLFLAEAGVLNGLSATTHPGYYDKLRSITAEKGKTTVYEERFVVNKIDEKKGLRVVTSGGVTCGLDSCLWLIGNVAGAESKENVATIVQYAYRDGLVV
jgi:transcriptional regulator GlxA family with amidase domain